MIRWLVIALLLLGPTARGADLDYAAFKTALIEGAGQKLDAKIAELDAKLASESDESVRAPLGRARADLVLLKKRVDDVSNVDALWDSMKNARTAIAKLGEEANRDWGGSVHLGILNLKELDRVAKASEVAGKAVDYGFKLKKLSADLAAISTSELSPSTKQLAESLSVISALLSNFGDKAPLVGSILKGYGDLAAELLKATTALDTSIAAREGGQIIEGVHGDRGAMLDALHKRGFDDAQRLPGLRDAFKTGDNQLVIWDRKARDWVVATGLDATELTKRYIYFARRGIKEPTPEQIIGGYAHAFVLALEPSTDRVPPGGTVALAVRGTLVGDGGAATGSATLSAAGGQLSAASVELGGTVTWVAPDELGAAVAITAQAKDAAGPASVTLRTGATTHLALVASPNAVAAHQTVELTARLTDEDGKALPASLGGMIELTVDIGEATDQVDLADQKGTKFTWTAPDHAARATAIARFAGTIGTASSEARLVIEVGTAPVDAGVDARTAIDAGEPDAGVAAVIDAAAPAVIDWPGTWRGKVKTVMTDDGKALPPGTDSIELVVATTADGHVRLTRAGFPPVDLARTASNPNAATGSGPLPRPAVATAMTTNFVASYKWTAFLSGQTLNIAVHMDIDQDVTLPKQPTRHSHTAIDSIGVLDRVR